MTISTHIIYLLAATLFILGLKKLGSPKTARNGNQLAMTGMFLAVIITLFDRNILDFTYIIMGVIIGAAIGCVGAKKVEMTAMPQMVAIFNGLGGAASALVAFSEYNFQSFGGAPELSIVITILLSVFIGTMTFTGSIVAFSKLQGILRGAPVIFSMQKAVNGILLLFIFGCGVALVYNPLYLPFLTVVVILAAVLGISSVLPIGGADMPVVISLLNSYSGLAASATGFVLHNNMLIISGALVGASGIILTKIMCKAMNRSLGNVLFASVGTGGGSASKETSEGRKVVEYTAEDAASVLESAQTLIIVPGYGLAVAQAQHVLHEMTKLLMEKGVNARYAIHPVAGRMPGHMNVLLAEANVSYDLLYEMDAVNDDFKNTDVALVIGANDVINPAARNREDSPLYGMPILNVDKAKSVMILKRSLASGFSGVDNELFYSPKTMMVFGDAKNTVAELTRILKG